MHLAVMLCLKWSKARFNGRAGKNPKMQMNQDLPENLQIARVS